MSLDELFDHPCKETCSGWKQGYDKGKLELQKENERLEKENALLEECRAFYANQWTSWEGSRGERIIPHDREITEENRPSGGKLARETKAKIDKLKEGSDE